MPLTVLVNPAGMADLGITDVRMDLGFGLLNPPREVNGQESDSDWYMMPTGAAVFNVNDKLFLGMGLGGISGMGVNVDDIYAAMAGNQPVVTTKQVFRFSPAAAYKVNDALTLGASLNIVNQSLAMSFVGGADPGQPAAKPAVRFRRDAGRHLQDQSQAAGGPDLVEQDRCFRHGIQHRRRHDQLRHGHARLGCLRAWRSSPCRACWWKPTSSAFSSMM